MSVSQMMFFLVLGAGIMFFFGPAVATEVIVTLGIIAICISSSG